jgi:hypothetical protein
LFVPCKDSTLESGWANNVRQRITLREVTDRDGETVRAWYSAVFGLPHAGYEKKEADTHVELYTSPCESGLNFTLSGHRFTLGVHFACTSKASFSPGHGGIVSPIAASDS